LLTASDGIADEEAVAPTVMATSVTHEAPLLPHALTCRVWVPVPDATDVSTDVPLKTVVSVLLSREYPIEDTFWDEQFAAVADRLNGDPTWAPLVGVLTVTLATTGTVRVASKEEMKENLTERKLTAGDRIFINLPRRELNARRCRSWRKTTSAMEPPAKEPKMLVFETGLSERHKTYSAK